MEYAKSSLTVLFKKMEISYPEHHSSSRATASVPRRAQRQGQARSTPPGFSSDPQGPMQDQAQLRGKGPYLWIRAAESFSRFRLFLSAWPLNALGNHFKPLTKSTAWKWRGHGTHRGSSQLTTEVEGTQTTAPHSLGLLLKHQNLAQRRNHHPCSAEWTWGLQPHPLCTPELRGTKCASN